MPETQAPWFFRVRAGRAIGLLLLLAGLVRYRSWEATAVFGRWSYAYAGVVAAVGLTALVAVVATLRARRREGVPPSGAGAFDLGVVCFGAAHLVTALDDPARAGRIVELDLVGSIHPVAAALEWASLLFFLVWILATGARRLNRGKPALYMLGSVVATLLLCEGAARLYVQLAPEPQGFPTRSGDVWLRRFCTHNAEGFRDGEHERAAAPGVRRLLVVGDSIAYGIGVEDPGDRVGERAVGELSEWEAINAGIADTHTLEHLGFLERMQVYRPDAVVLLYFFNDIDYLAPVTERGDAPVGRLARLLSPKFFLLRNSYLFNELYVRVRGLAFQASDREHAELPPDPYLDGKLLDRHLAEVQRFIETARQGGARAWVVPFDVRTVLGEPHTIRYRAFLEAAGRRGIPLLDPAPLFEGYAFEELTANPRDSHPNAVAHGLVARFLAAKLAE